jgi:hypothetical protein
MKFNVKDCQFSISEIGYDMMQVIADALEDEKSKCEFAIEHIKECLKTDITINQIKQYENQLEFIENKKIELESNISDCNKIFELYFLE